MRVFSQQTSGWYVEFVLAAFLNHGVGTDIMKKKLQDPGVQEMQVIPYGVPDTLGLLQAIAQLSLIPVKRPTFLGGCYCLYRLPVI